MGFLKILVDLVHLLVSGFAVPFALIEHAIIRNLSILGKEVSRVITNLEKVKKIHKF